MKEFRQITLKTFVSHGYNLTPIELAAVVPFAVKRTYYITDFGSDAQTGEHCHKLEEEFFIQIAGSSVVVIDRGKGKEEIKLQGPSDAIYVPNYVWHGFKHPSPGCVILALSSTNYRADRSDYIEDYKKYLTIRDQMLQNNVV